MTKTIKLLATLVAIFASIAVSSATIGLDVSAYHSVSKFKCLYNKGYRFAIIRAYRSYGVVDSNAIRNIQNAKKAGFKYVDVYMFPCYHCWIRNPSQGPWIQVRSMLRQLKPVDSLYGMVWLDVEGTKYWSSSKSKNLQFIKHLYNAVNYYTGGRHYHRHKVGIYSSPSQWKPITGNSKYFANKVPIWYAHYDNKASFSDWYRGYQFGGWKKPSIKQYKGTTRLCGATIDKNFY